jgi:hypothetical protein
MKTSKITTLAAIATAPVAATIALPAIAHADDTITFQSPSGNIRCDMFASTNTQPPVALCQIWDHTYAASPGSARDGGPCPSDTDVGSDVRLDQGKPAYFTCTYSALNSGVGPWPTLDYRQTRSLGTITCDSETSGITCTDTGSGHFFRVSRESYQLG